MPKITVVIPVYNVEKYIERCLDSLVDQTCSDFDLVVVDDGSTDGSAEICRRFEAKDPRVIFISQENQGVSAARNTGIEWALEHSSSNWITFIDSDDWIRSDYLEQLLNLAVREGADITSCAFQQTDRFCRDLPSNDTALQFELLAPDVYFLSESTIASVAWAKLYKKELFENIRFPVGKIHEDEFTTYKLLFSVKTIGYISQPLYYYFENPNGIMRSPWSVERLDGVRAILEQIDYFDRGGWKSLAEKRIKVVLLVFAMQVEDVSRMKLSLSQEDCEAIQAVQADLRRMLKEKRNFYRLQWPEDRYIYEALYPVRMRWYWRFHKVFHSFGG